MKAWCFAFVVAAWWCLAASDCDVIIGDRSYMKETLVSDLYWSHGLAIDFDTNYLYYSVYDLDKNVYRNEKVHIRTKIITVIEELHGMCSYAVDQVRGKVHAACRPADGGHGRLYTLDSNTGQFKLTRVADRDMMFLHYHEDTLLYSGAPEFELYGFTYRRKNNLSLPVWQVTNLVVDAQGDCIFTNNTGVYRRRGLEDVPYPEYSSGVQAVGVDGRGGAYTCTNNVPRGIWKLHDHALATKVVDVQCTDMTFDKEGNIVYSDNGRSTIMRLLPC